MKMVKMKLANIQYSGDSKNLNYLSDTNFHGILRVKKTTTTTTNKKKKT